jgi:hypothetical protein
VRRRLVLTFFAATLPGLAIVGFALATGEKPFVTTIGNLRITANDNFSPTLLPKNELAPITLNLSGKIETLDHTHPPALQELPLEFDRSVEVEAVGLPICRPYLLEDADIQRDCKDALVGTGEAAFELAFPESAPFIATSKLLAFNAGTSGGKTTIFIHAYLSSPVSAAVVTTVKISKIPNGRYGTKAIATIPKIAGGYGSPLSFSLKVGRKFTYKGKRQSYLLAKCPDGHLQAKGIGVFSGNLRLAGSLVRACTPK